MRYTQKLRNNEQGMAAIVITMVLMIVISLIVLGFAQVTRREQRQALDRQLVTQAYYAAESGVNLAQSRIAEYIFNNPGTAVLKDDCPEDDGGILQTGDYIIDSTSSTEITCLLISSGLSNLSYQDVDTQSIVANVESTNPITEIAFSWQASSGADRSPGCVNTPTQLRPASGAGAWGCNQPLLRVDIVPIGASLSQAGLQGSQFTRFFYPVSAGGINTAAYSAGSMSVSPVSTRCSSVPAPGPYKCRSRITGLTGTRFGVRVMAIYGTANLDISAYSGGSRQTLINGQLLIDSTAKANDILRRIQTRVSSSANIVPDFGLVAGGTGLCKRYVISGTDPVTTRTPDTGC